MNRIAAIALFALATLVASASAPAQRNLIEVNVPFNFTVSNTSLPAGTYTFSLDSTMPDLLVVRDRANALKAMDLGERGSMGAGKLRTLFFRRYGNQYFLSEVGFDSASAGISLPVTKLENRARKVNRNVELASIAAR